MGGSDVQLVSRRAGLLINTIFHHLILKYCFAQFKLKLDPIFGFTS